MEYAIKYEKINLGDDKFVFKPVCVIKGQYDKDAGIFVTDYGDYCNSINGESQYEDNYFGYVTTVEELQKAYGKDLEIQELLTEYFDSFFEFYNLAYFDYTANKLITLAIPRDGLENAYSGEKTDKEEITDTIDNVDRNTSEGEAIVGLQLEDLEILREINNLEDLHASLDEIISFLHKSKDVVKKEESTSRTNSASKKLALKKEASKKNNLLELRKEVKAVIKGQDKAVDDVTRAIVVNQLSKNPRHKSHMLILGPSGTGKTEMINIISNKMGIPYFKADATAYTKEGYVGKSVYSMFNGLIQAAGGDVKKAQKGILIIDEIDKKLSPRKDDVGGVDVLNSLLKIMDRDIIELDSGKGPVLFDTSNLTIIFMGAFADIYKSKEENKNKKSIGFATETKEETKNKIVVTNEDLIKAGMPPEFLGRIPVVTNTEELELETLVEILYKSKGGAIDEEKEFCKGLGINIKFTSNYMKEIAKKAHESKTGARNLRKLVRESVAVAYDDILTKEGVKTLKLTKKTALNPKDYCIEYM